MDGREESENEIKGIFGEQGKEEEKVGDDGNVRRGGIGERVE